MAESSLRQAISDLYISGLCSDLDIRCGSRTFKVHRAILGARSPVLQKACAEPGWKEAKEGVLNIGDSEDGGDPSDDPVAVEMLLEFIYNDDYFPSSLPYGATPEQTADDVSIHADKAEADAADEEGPRLEEPAQQQELEDNSSTTEDAASMDSGVLDLHAKLYALGDKYDIPKLKHCALDKFEVDGERLEWSDAAFGMAISTAFSTTPFSDTRLKASIVEILHDRAAQQAMSDEMNAQICSVPELARMLWTRSVCKPRPKTCQTCGTLKFRQCPGPDDTSTECSSTFVACDCVPADTTCSMCSGPCSKKCKCRTCRFRRRKIADPFRALMEH